MRHLMSYASRFGAGTSDVLHEKTNLLEDRQTYLELFLSLIAKVVSPNHYTTVMEHSTSLTWVFNMIREDYDIQTRGIHILNILDLKYDAARPFGEHTCVYISSKHFWFI